MLRFPCCLIIMLLCSFPLLCCHLPTVLECLTVDHISSTRILHIPLQTILCRYITVGAEVCPRPRLSS
ncbi:hypothetical protein P691DRAFT_808782 [Macrolepiota fuliginosa MF-IS2]|uniref:Secreted protein n=1 Tax=Macrolepiota fuliginosa MF-IS2 TaxID=1400762 RepID=A0A9P5XI30_9AGAR|nr:hypothetical protein P691DRAFT_808782 [Macrolepiota fuliginosa MF-IS2]